MVVLSVVSQGKKQSRKVFIFISSKEADLRWWGACCYSYRWGMMYRLMIQELVMKFMLLKFKGTKHCTIVELQDKLTRHVVQKYCTQSFCLIMD